MGRRVRPAGGGCAPATGETQGIDRCPRCGAGDLFSIEVCGGRGGAWRAVYCAGVYDRERRRFLRRSCGLAERVPGGPSEAGSAPGAAGTRATTAPV